MTNGITLNPKRFLKGGKAWSELCELVGRDPAFDVHLGPKDFLPKPATIAPEHQMTSDNPDADIGYSGFDVANLNHAIDSPFVQAALAFSNHQSVDGAYGDVGKFKHLKLGDEWLARLYCDKFGAPGVTCPPGFDKRFGNTVKSMTSVTGFAKHSSVDFCPITELDALSQMLGGIANGIPFSFDTVRHKFGRKIGDFAMFWPSQFPHHGAEAIDLLGESVDPASYTEDDPFDPKVIYLCLPWLSHSHFAGEYNILILLGKGRLFVVNCGTYAGGVKKPINCEWLDYVLWKLNMSCRHWAVGWLGDGSAVAKGDATAIGKTELVIGVNILGDEGVLDFLDPTTGNVVQKLDLSENSPILVDNPNVTVAAGDLKERLAASDDLTAAEHGSGLHIGQADEVQTINTANQEGKTFNRIDLETGQREVPLVWDYVEGRLPKELRRYFTQVEFDEETQMFKPGHYRLLDPKTGEYFELTGDSTIDAERNSTNPRLTHDNDERVPGHKPATLENPAPVRAVLKSWSIPESKRGWWMPPFVRLTPHQYRMHDLDSRRSNKGNPAMAEVVGAGDWIKEGPGGKSFFTGDRGVEIYRRDLPFYRSFADSFPIFLVSEGGSSGLRHSFKYGGTLIWRFVWEHFRDRLIEAPLIMLPGVTTGGVPDLDYVLGKDRISKELWDPRVWPEEYVAECAAEIDQAARAAANKLLAGHGLNEVERRALSKDMNEIALGSLAL